MAAEIRNRQIILSSRRNVAQAESILGISDMLKIRENQ
jgi:hypothetical protein